MAGLIVITGPPGAGKSTVAAMLVESFEPSALIAGDEFFAAIRRGFLAPWTEAAHRQNETVVGAAAVASGRIAQGGYTVVYDGVIGPWFLEAFLAATGLPEIDYAMLLPPEEVCLRRIETRVGHGFADADAARHMFREFDGAAATVPAPQVIRSTGPPESIAADIGELQRARTLRIQTASDAR